MAIISKIEKLNMKKIILAALLLLFDLISSAQPCTRFLNGDRSVMPCSDPVQIDLNELFLTDATFVSTVLFPTDTLPGTSGTDTVILYMSKTKVVATKNSCIDSAIVRVLFRTDLLPDLGPDTTLRICPDKTVDITKFYDPGFFTARWSTPVPQDVDTGFYSLIIRSRDACTDTAFIRVLGLAKLDLGNDTTLTVRFEDRINLLTFYNTTGLVTQWNTPNPSSVGKGTYRLQVTNGNECQDTAFVTVRNFPKPDLGPDLIICSELLQDLTALFNTSELIMNWGTSTPTAAGAGIYTITATNSFNSKDTVKVTIHNNEMPELGVQNVEKCRDEFINIDIYFDLSSATSVTWSVPNPESIQDQGIYQVTAYNALGCKREGSVVVTFFPGTNLKDTTVKTCNGNTKDLTRIYNLTGLSNINWSTPSPTMAGPGTYTLTVTDDVTGCVYDYKVTVVTTSSTTTPFPSPCIYNTSNSSAFSTNSFRSIMVDKNNEVWAGADLGGLYRFVRNGEGCSGTWQKSNQQDPGSTYKDLVAHDYAALCNCSSDDLGIWAANTGHTGIQAITGGVYQIGDYNFTTRRFGSVDDVSNNGNLSSRFANSVVTGLDGFIYVALSQSIRIASSTIMEGGIYKRPLTGSGDQFTEVQGLTLPESDIRVTCAGRRGEEIWFAVDRYCGGGCTAGYIIRYNTTSQTQSGVIRNPLPFTPNATTPIVRSIYTDSIGRTYVGMNNNAGIAVLDTGNTWKQITNQNSPLPNGASVNFNAITEVNGEIWIGTTQGLLVYDGVGDFADCASYTLYTTVHNLPSNNVTDIAYDNSRFEVWITTDAGIFRTRETHAVAGTILDVSCGPYTALSSTMLKNPIEGVRVSLITLDGTLVDEQLTDATGNFSLHNGEPNTQYKLQVKYLDKYNYEFNNIGFNRFVGDVLIPNRLIEELNTFRDELKYKKFNFTAFGIEGKDPIIGEGYDTTFFYFAYRHFISATVTDFHKKRVDDLASFYVTLATIYEYGNSSNDLFIEYLANFVETIKLILSVGPIADNLSLSKVPGVKLGNRFELSQAKQAQIKLAEAIIKTVELVYTKTSEKFITDPEAKKSFDLGFGAIKKVSEYIVGAIKDGLTSNSDDLFKSVVSFITEGLIQKAAAVSYENFCNVQHRDFIKNAALSCLIHENPFDYETNYKRMYSLENLGASNSLNKIRNDDTSVIKTLLRQIKSDAEVAGMVNTFATLGAAISGLSVAGAWLAPLFEGVAVSAEVAKIAFSALGAYESYTGHLKIKYTSNRVGPQSAFTNVQRAVSTNTTTLGRSRRNLTNGLPQQGIFMNQQLLEFKMIVNAPYDSIQFDNKFNTLVVQHDIYKKELEESLDQIWPYAGYAMNNIPGFKTNFSITIDSFVSMQHQLMFAFYNQVLAYMLDTLTSQRVPTMNRIIDRIVSINDSTTNRIGSIITHLNSYALPETSYLEKEKFSIYYDYQPNSTGKAVYEFVNKGNTIFNNVGIKISQPTGGFSLLSTDTIFIGNIQPGERKIVNVFFSSPATDTIGNYDLVINSDTTTILEVGTLLVCSKKIDNSISYTLKDGLWSDPSTWSTGEVPADITAVNILHRVNVDINAVCKSLYSKIPGYVIVNTGKNLTILK